MSFRLLRFVLLLVLYAVSLGPHSEAQDEAQRATFRPFWPSDREHRHSTCWESMISGTLSTSTHPVRCWS
jgi:hypothetical protein